jgi:uncharacterized membrane protein
MDMDHSANAEYIVLAPHRSLNSRSARWFVASVALPLCGVAALFTAMGYWPVLPFAGLELVVFVVALSINLRGRFDTQSVSIDEDHVVIDTRQRSGNTQIVFPRHWAQVKLRRAKSPWHPSRLTIESHGRACELGSFLTEEGRCVLAERLRRSIGRVAESPRLQRMDR